MKSFNRISKLMSSCKRSSFNRDIEEEEEVEQIQYDNSICLSSSYYSVFVVRLAMMVMLAILIGLLTLLTWHITRIYTTKSLNTLAYGLRHELLQRPLLRMWNILNSTVEVATAQVKLSESVIRRYNKKPFVDQAQQVELYEVMKDITWAMFASRKALNSVTLNYRNGFVQGFHRNHKTNNTFYIYSDLANYSISAADSPSNSHKKEWNDQSIRGNISAIWYQEPLDPKTGEKLGKATPIPPDELINIAGISQVPDGTASWHIAVSKYSDSPLLSAALPVWDDPSHQRIVAVVGVTTALYSVGQLMKELVEFHSGHIYLTTQEGWLLATSTNNSVLTNSITGPKLMMSVNSSDHVIRSGALCLQKRYGDSFPINQQVRIENAKLGHHLYYIDSFFLNLKRLPMVGVVIIPREYIMGKVDEKAWKTLKIIISASLCILVVGCLCIFILTNGVSKEMNLRAALISNLAARRKAEASNNYKSQFLANMSHELRTPMAAVIGLLDILMSDDCLTNEQHSMITQIRKCSTTLLRLLNNILDISKVESGKLILEETEFDLGRELEGLIDMFSVQCNNHNVEIVLDFSDDMPKIVQGDSGRVLQIFANLISNSIKFTSSGHIILRGWCETLDNNTATSSIASYFSINQSETWSAQKLKWKRDGKICSKMANNKMILCFEVDDTGCGIDPSKWESVFESFEQADPSTTRLHGGTGLGLCIVRTLVKKMNGEIKVVNKSGPGTLMQLYLLFGSTLAETTNQHCQFNFAEHNMNVLLALNGRATRSIMTKWLKENGVSTHEASDWNELTQSLKQFFIKHKLFPNPPQESNNNTSSVSVIIVDIGLLDLNTEIWKQQLNFLDKYRHRANFAWILNHNTSSSNGIKVELRKRGYLVMVNNPLYKAKLIQIFQTIQHGTQPETTNTIDEIDHSASSLSSDDDGISTNTTTSVRVFQRNLNEEKCLKGIRLLLAEDTAVLQRVATIMLEKMGADVFVVGDGIQAVDALKDYVMKTDLVIDESEFSGKNLMPFDLVLMDCQMPQMDGYEATKVIRRSECGTGMHIPIVALTAHAMSCDEMKCLEVGMDAYLTKPIDKNLMASTILTLTKGRTTWQ